MSRLRVYINPFNTTGTAYAGWQEVTKDVLFENMGTLSLTLDISDYDVGVFTNSGLTLDLNNNTGKYSDVGTVSSIFNFTRANSGVKITWDQSDTDSIAGFVQAQSWMSNEVILYEGIINDDATTMQLADQSIEFQILGYESILDRFIIDSDWGHTALGLGAPPSGSIAQSDNIVVTPVGSYTYDGTLAGQNWTYTAPSGSPTAATVTAGIQAAMAALSGAGVTVTASGANVNILGNVPGVSFTDTIFSSTYMTLTATIPADAGATSQQLIERIFQIASAVVPGSLIYTVNNSLINPNINFGWDVVTGFPTQTLKAALETILTAENSVLYMSGTTPVVSARTPGGSVAYTFYGPSSPLGAENILDIQDIFSGMNRVFNYVTWTPQTGAVLVAQNAASVAQYGARPKAVDVIDGITNLTTIATVLGSLQAEFSSPKQEMTLFAGMNYGTMALGLLTRVAIDYPLMPIDPNPAIYGQAVYGTSEYPINVSTFTITTATNYKIIGIEYDLPNQQVEFTLRAI